MDGWTDGRMDGWMVGWMDGWIIRSMDTWIYSSHRIRRARPSGPRTADLPLAHLFPRDSANLINTGATNRCSTLRRYNSSASCWLCLVVWRQTGLGAQRYIRHRINNMEKTSRIHAVSRGP